MTSETSIEELRTILAQVLEVSAAQVGDEDHFAEVLEIDSLLRLEISARVETEMGVRLPDDEMASTQTLSGLSAMVDALKGGAAAS